MRVVIAPRGEGKTERMLRKSAECHLYIVCNSHKTSHALVTRAKNLGLSIPYPIAYDEFLSGQYCGKHIKGFIVDNLDMLLARLSRTVPIEFVTMTGPHIEFDSDAW